MRTIITKTEFAALKSRTLSAVSHWIKTGRITKAALIGDGPRAKVWLEQADYDLAHRLDPAKQSAQDAPVLPVASARAPAVPAATPVLLSDASTTAPSADDHLERRRIAEADRAEQLAIEARRKNAIEEGRWIDAEEATKAWSKELAALWAGIDVFLANTVARDLSERPPADWKSAATRLRQLLREHRAMVAIDAAQRRHILECADTGEETEGTSGRSDQGGASDGTDVAAAAAA